MNNKIILVTGANKGIGYQIAKKFSELGHTVFIGARNPDLGKKAECQLRETGLDCRFLELDVTDEMSVQKAAAYVENKFGKLDVLVNNAGIFLDTPRKTHEITVNEFRLTLETNVLGVFSVTMAFLPLLKKSERANIINMSSDLGSLQQASDPNSKYDSVSGPSYRVSKAALNMLTLSLARELRNTNITVNAVSPGWCKTDLGSDAAPRTAETGADTPVWLAIQDENDLHGHFLFDKATIAW